MKILKTILCILLSSMILLFAGACDTDKQKRFSIEDENFLITVTTDKTKLKGETDEIWVRLFVEIKQDVEIGTTSTDGITYAAVDPFSGFKLQSVLDDKEKLEGYSLTITHPAFIGFSADLIQTLPKGAKYEQVIRVQAGAQKGAHRLCVYVDNSYRAIMPSEWCVRTVLEHGAYIQTDIVITVL